MKNHYDSSIILHFLNETIQHCEEQGLPLHSIELTPEEWADFKKALLAVPGWNATIDEMDSKAVNYHGTRIFEGTS